MIDVNLQSRIQRTYAGRIEERMPMLGIYMPEWYKRKIPNQLNNLKTNKVSCFTKVKQCGTI